MLNPGLREKNLFQLSLSPSPPQHHLTPCTIQLALDVILRALIASQDFARSSVKNWTIISRAVHGSTPNECSQRFDELAESNEVFTTYLASRIFTSGDVCTFFDEHKRHQHEKTSLLSTYGNSYNEEDFRNNGVSSSCTDEGPIIVIHVCDEAKNVKCDFHCPRDLLVHEMKYFAEYLSSDSQRCQDVDISVHCDVQIFDWLMRYSKRNYAIDIQSQNLEASNVVSILISSDFLKMDCLVQDCVEFCHMNMDSIVATNCNMNCIHNDLLKRISDLFTHNEADSIVDRRDKVKSKLFCKKLEQLFLPNDSSGDSVDNEASLFRCKWCHRLMTFKLEKLINCTLARTMIGRHGAIMSRHSPDSSFNINTYLVDLRVKLMSWQAVYWNIWGTVNALRCLRCGEVFQLTNYGYCVHHPEMPIFNNFDPKDSVMSCVGFYPCCNVSALRYDPLRLNKGCHVKDHIVNCPDSSTTCDDESSLKLDQRVYSDFMAHRNIIAFQFDRLLDNSTPGSTGDCCDLFRSVLHPVNGQVCQAADQTPTTSLPPVGYNLNVKRSNDSRRMTTKQPASKCHQSNNSFLNLDSGAVDKESAIHFRTADNDPGISLSCVSEEERQIVVFGNNTVLARSARLSEWDVHQSIRCNQDGQRQNDGLCFRAICQQLTSIRLSVEKVDCPKKEVAGGTFYNVDGQWKSLLSVSTAKQYASLHSRIEKK